MRQRLRPRPESMAAPSWRLCLALCVGLWACTHAPVLDGRIGGLREIVYEAERNGAYNCAPVELAAARSELNFAAIELAQGDQARAEEHLVLAEPNARAALELSPPERCQETRSGDQDGDGIPDAEDACPTEPEDADGIDDADGCPDDQDSDGDGFSDSVDLCIAEPEDVDGYLDSDGCPDLDNDADGIGDRADECPDAPEDPDGFEDADGCPDEDNDADSLLDVDDACPNEVGPPSEKGCPKVYKDVEVTTTHIRITQKVYFATGKTQIMARSFGLLDTVAQVLADYPEIRIEVQGHTDDQGSDRYNQGLSEQRADAVRQYLVNHGVEPYRATAKGYGEERPIESNRTRVGRAANRRVEFVRTDDAAVKKNRAGGVPPAGEGPPPSP